MIDSELMREIIRGDSNIATLEQLRPTQLRNLQRAWEHMISCEIRQVLVKVDGVESRPQEEERLASMITYNAMKKQFVSGFEA